MAKITKVSEADLKKRILAVEADRLKNRRSCDRIAPHDRGLRLAYQGL
jgi:hypothetical protein